MKKLLSFFAALFGQVFQGLRQPGLARDEIIHALDAAISKTVNSDLKTAAFVVEIDDFRTCEYCRTSAETAQILRVVENRLRDCAGARDQLRYFSGGRFALVRHPSRRLTPVQAEAIALSIQNAVEAPIRHPTRQTHLTVSIGYALHSQITPPNGETLFAAANVALQEAARKGPASLCAYAPDMLNRIESRLSLARQAGTAIATGDVRPFFQPQIELSSGRVCGFEALARWNHQDRGMIPPAEFLPVFEETGLMQEFGLSMLRQSLKALQEWDQADLDIASVSVNMSAAELRNPNLIDAICLELDNCDISADRLVIEVLETVIAHGEDDRIFKRLEQLRGLGCKLDLDDFGTGQTSITSIRQFGVDRIKIDRSFVTDADRDPDQEKMIGAIVMMADRLSVQTLAEGVETQGELNSVWTAGCGSAQGYAISRPLPVTDVANWLRAHRFGQDRDSSQRYLQ